MKIVSNIGTDRVIDLLGPYLKPGSQLDVVTPNCAAILSQHGLSNVRSL